MQRFGVYLGKKILEKYAEAFPKEKKNFLIEKLQSW